MNQREAEPADVRPFLPRPGEPVEEYAERLRAMHRDLSVVLQAVERGLQRANPPEEEPEREREPMAVHASAVSPPAFEARMASAAREPSGAALRESVPGAPRVEVVTSRAGHRAGDESVTSDWAQGEPFVERRQPVVPQPPVSERPPADPLRIIPVTPPQQPLAERPSADPRYAEPPRGEWAPAVVTDTTGAVAAPAPAPTVAPAPAPAPLPMRAPLLPPWAIAAILAGWLTIVALLLALLIDG